MSDRLLHYSSSSSTPVRRPRHSFYAIASCFCAVVSIGLGFALHTDSMDDAVWPLAVCGVFATSAAALVGCILGALEPTERRTFLWIAVALTVLIPVMGGVVPHALMNVIYGL